jgi:acyl-CoA thioester hydrolase
MRPKPFLPQALENPSFVRDSNSGLVWYQCELRTLYIDTDRSQVVYHSNYLKYFEFARASLMRETNYPYKRIEEDGFVYPIIKTELNYFSPLFYDDLMYIHIRPGKRERVRIQFDYLITKAETGEVSCTGFTRHCAINAKGIPVEIDPQTIKLWQEFPDS